jgi:hypothetical protein
LISLESVLEVLSSLFQLFCTVENISYFFKTNNNGIEKKTYFFSKEPESFNGASIGGKIFHLNRAVQMVEIDDTKSGHIFLTTPFFPLVYKSGNSLFCEKEKKSINS